MQEGVREEEEGRTRVRKEGVQRHEWMGMEWGRPHGWSIWNVGHQDGRGC